MGLCLSYTNPSIWEQSNISINFWVQKVKFATYIFSQFSNKFSNNFNRKLMKKIIWYGIHFTYDFPITAQIWLQIQFALIATTFCTWHTTPILLWCADTVKLISPLLFPGKKWVGPAKLLCMTMVDITCLISCLISWIHTWTGKSSSFHGAWECARICCFLTTRKWIPAKAIAIEYGWRDKEHQCNRPLIHNTTRNKIKLMA